VSNPTSGEPFKLAETDPRPLPPCSQSMLFHAGFRDGAGSRAMAHDRQGFEAYKRGYAAGYHALGRACSTFNEAIGYQPSILRIQGDEE
jgi:hypothetical protein